MADIVLSKMEHRYPATRTIPEPGVGLLGRLSLALAACYMRQTPIPLGRWRLIPHFLPLLRKYGATMGDRTVTTRHGFKMRVDLGDWLGQYVYLTGSYEPQTAEVIAALVERDDTVVDVGANAGFFSLLAASRVGPAGRVLAFEPVPAVWAALNVNLELNAARNVAVHHIALADAAGMLTMHEGPPGHRGTSSLRPLNTGSVTYEVEVRALDDWLPILGRVKLIKIDVEGAEQIVIQGMRGLIERDAPHLVVEVTDTYLRQMGHSASSLFSELAASGYRMFQIGERGLTPIDQPSPAWDAQFNALFCRGSQLPSRLESMLTS